MPGRGRAGLLRDEQLKPVISEVRAVNYGVYGVRKMHATLRRDGVAIGRDHTDWLMRGLGLAGVRRGTAKPITRSDASAARPWTWWAASSSRPGRTHCGCAT